ncbi:MAG: ABC transporter substrate-binding protein [Deltaproteobacteria bacterium]|jgi:iron complex transport system substrate-binding protein|nr:ABC transporter substrate-binding protein [Deltaproteobacteria bacterium]
MRTNKTNPAPRPSETSAAAARTAVAAALVLTLVLTLALVPASAAGGSGAAGGPRIISLYAADTEILLRLGSRDNLVGVSRQETYDGPETEGWVRPPEFSVRDDVEKFLAAAPDYVFLRPMHLSSNPALFDALTRAGVKLWTRQCVRASDLEAFWREMALVVGKSAEVEVMIAEFEKTMESLGAPSSAGGPGVFLESVHKEIKTFAPDSIPVWLLTLAGGRNVAADARPAREGLVIADYGPERLLEKAAEVDVYIAQEGPMNSVPTETIRRRDVTRTLPAFKNNRVHRVPEELISRPTPSLAEGLRLMAEIVGGGGDKNQAGDKN